MAELSRPAILISPCDHLFSITVYDARRVYVVAFVTCHRERHMDPLHIRSWGEFLAYPFVLKLFLKGCLIEMSC